MTKRLWSEALVTTFLFWLPIDLLYLYYDGNWYDPNRFIEVAELVLLYCIPIFAICRLVLLLKKELIDKNMEERK